MARIPQLRPVPVRQRSIIKVDENDEKIALRRMVAGRGILRNHGRNNNSPETGLRKPSGVGVPTVDGDLAVRSEERRVGKECRSRWWRDQERKRRRERRREDTC